MLWNHPGIHPKTIEATKDSPLPDFSVLSPEQQLTLVATGTRTVALGQDIRIIGECINPTTNAALKEELRRGELSLVKKLAMEQKKKEPMSWISISVCQILTKRK